MGGRLRHGADDTDGLRYRRGARPAAGKFKPATWEVTVRVRVAREVLSGTTARDRAKPTPARWWTQSGNPGPCCESANLVTLTPERRQLRDEPVHRAFLG